MFFYERLLAYASFLRRPFGLVVLVGVVFCWPASGQAAGTCEAYGTGTQVGTISEETLAEASGLAASHINPGIYWTLNDSGNPPLVFAIDKTGALIEVYEVSGALNVDWEDIALGPCPDGCSCLFVADMGDNLEVRPVKTIYRFPEPVIGTGQGSTATANEMTFSYPDGRHDAETLLVDPRSGDIYIVSKVEDGHSSVYRFPSPDPENYPVILEKVTDIEMTGDSSNALLATGGSVAADGGRLLVRALDHAQEYTIPEGGSLGDAFTATPVWIPLPSSSQGEGITYNPDGMSLVTVSENLPAPVHEVPCEKGSPVTEPASSLLVVCSDGTGCGSERQVGSAGKFAASFSVILAGLWMAVRRRRRRSRA